MMQKLIFTSVFFVMSSSALGHESTAASGFMTGLLHPVLGYDHLLAMLSVGILSSQMGGRAIWTVPAIFVLMMLVGGIIGLQEISLPWVEFAIGLSVLCLGIAIAAYRYFPSLIAMIVVGFFAIFHGHAHGTEMPYISDAIFYTIGFISGTILIHVIGVFISLFVSQLKSGKSLLRYLGAGIAGIGFAVLFL